MSKIAFVFPGQGSQVIGMGKDWAAANPKSAEYFERANTALGFDLKKIMWEGPDSDLGRTIYTQPALLTASMAHFELLKAEGKTPSVVAGHSLGEYSALTAAGSLSFEDAVKIVHLRGKLMEEAVPAGLGGMAAVIGLEESKILEGFKTISGKLEIANYNAPDQIVISGEKTAVDQSVAVMTALGAKMVVVLKVSGPFHSSLIASAGSKLRVALDQIQVKAPSFPIIANVTADYVSDPTQIKDLLGKQVSSSVRWTQTIQKLIREGVDEFVECGSGKVLAGLIRKIKVAA
jgi:[acyl-carrier-protein] S-malonyltransferase